MKNPRLRQWPERQVLRPVSSILSTPRWQRIRNIENYRVLVLNNEKLVTHQIQTSACSGDI
jgi:hypothetical protein